MLALVPRVVGASCRRFSSRTVNLAWPDGRPAGSFLPKFLRENTVEAWDVSSKQRLDFCLHADLQVTEVQAEGRAFRLCFSDGHVGTFLPPRPAPEMWSQGLMNKPRTLWGSSNTAAVQEELERGSLRFEWEELIQDSSSAARRWIEAMHSHGVALVAGLPQDAQAMQGFAAALGTYLVPTVYGETFQIQSVSEPNNLAYSSLGLQMHTDLPFYSLPPSLQLFQCLRQAEGGLSLALDGFDAARALRAAPGGEEAFKVLCSEQLRFQDITNDWFLSADHPTLLLSPDSERDPIQRLQRVHFNERSRDSWRQWLPNQPQASRIYEALHLYEQLVEERSRYVSLHLAPGEMICTDNWRVMHSRTSFTGSRHFVGGYLDWDAVRARWRALAGLWQGQNQLIQD
ncbi:unnamed protein product [Effrenium voratum]|nr:unnamed protein product [Effrenium voratum]